MRIYKITIFIFIFTLGVILDVSFVNAHVLKSDGSIGAVMHIQPEDDPIAGEQSGFFFEFKDKNNIFTPELCNCTFSILSNGKELYSQPLFRNNAEPSLTNASIFYTFPSKGVYIIRLSGTPKQPNTFKSFTLEFTQRVERTSDMRTQVKDNWLLDHIPHALGGIIGFSMLGFILIKQHKKL